MRPQIDIIEGAGPHCDTLFLDGAFNAFQAQAQGKRLVTFAVRGDASRAALTLGGDAGRWTSPVTGAFGGLACAGVPPASEVFSVVEAASAWLREEAGAISASIRSPPDFLDHPAAAAMENALHRAGWRLDQVEINHHLDLRGSADFRSGLGETKLKELRRLQRSGAVVAEAGPEASQAIYDIIADNRRSRGYPMTMTWPQVEALAASFPDRVRFFGVQRDDLLLAGALCLRITAECLYVFYWGENPQFRKESPVTLLADGLADYALENGFRALDIGISTAQSIPNSGLIAFKESLGCRTSARRTYALELG